MSKPDLDPPVTFCFAIRMDDSQQDPDLVFQEASGLSVEFAIEEPVEGDENHFKHRLPKGITHGDLLLKRGLAPKSHPIFRWGQKMLQGPLSNAIESKPILLMLLDGQGQSFKSWRLDNAYPVSWEISNFNAVTGEVLIESIKLAYQGINVV